MANKILILGKSGTGKSRAAKSLDPKETFIICPDEKGMPFQGWKNNYKTVLKEDGKLDIDKSNYYKTTSSETILRLLKYISDNRKEIKVVLIDTITLMMVAQFMQQVKIKGYEKFSDQAQAVYDIFKSIDPLRDDLTVIVTAHVDVDDSGNTDFAVIGGKLIKEKAKPVGMFNIVLETEVDYKDGASEYSFITQNNGKNVAKSPEGMFPEFKITNDYKYILECINKYEN